MTHTADIKAIKPLTAEALAHLHELVRIGVLPRDGIAARLLATLDAMTAPVTREEWIAVMLTAEATINGDYPGACAERGDRTAIEVRADAILPRLIKLWTKK